MSSLNGLPKQVPLANSPNPVGRGPGHAGRARPRAGDRPQRRHREQDLRRLALRRGRQPRREPRRPLPDQGQWRDLDPDPDSDVSHRSRPTLSINAVPTNDATQPNYDVISSPAFPQGNYTISLAVDPLNPNVVYFGGTSDGQTSGLIRIDTTGIYDSHAFVAFDNSLNDGGKLEINTAGRIQVTNYQDQGPAVRASRPARSIST